MRNFALFIFHFIAYFILLAAPADAAVESSVVTIYVENNSGLRIATGNGLIISPDGTVATDTQLVLAWLSSDDNSIVLRIGKSGYYPLKSLLSVDRDSGIALLKIDANGLRPASLDPKYDLSDGETVWMVGSPQGLGIETVEGTIKDTGGDGPPEISASVGELLGVPVLNQQGMTVALASIRDGRGKAVNIGDVLSLIEAPAKTGQEDMTAHMTVVKKAKAAMRTGRADAGDFFKLGAAYMKAGMADKAIEAFKEAVRLRPDFAEAYQGLGVAYASEKLHEEALESLIKAVTIRPDYAEAHCNLGFLYDYLGKREEAVASFQEAIRLKPKYAEAYNGLGVSFARARNYEEAIKSFESALRIRPESKKARFNLALSYISLGDRESAVSQERLLRDIDRELADRLLDFLKTDNEPDDVAEDGYDEERPEDEDAMH